MKIEYNMQHSGTRSEITDYNKYQYVFEISTNILIDI